MTLTDDRPALGASLAQIRTDYALLRWSLALVGIYVGAGLLGFVGFAGFWPPPGPELNAAEISSYFREHQTGIVVGGVMMAFAGPFYVTWSVAISKVIRRMEGPMGGLADIQRIGGLLTGLVTFTPGVIWTTAALRADERSDETIQMLYDFGWMFFDTTFVCSALQSVALGVAILIDRNAMPLFPRWFAWTSFLTAACYVPLLLMPLVTEGPLAWNGLVSFWVVFVEFFLFTVVATVLTWRALDRLEKQDLDEAAVQ